MKANDYIPLIRQKYPQEDPKDVLAMMEILATARAEQRGDTPTDQDWQFAGKILCVIFDPVKVTITGYSEQTKSLRRAYKNIAASQSAQETFRGSLRSELMSAETASDAIKVASTRCSDYRPPLKKTSWYSRWRFQSRCPLPSGSVARILA